MAAAAHRASSGAALILFLALVSAPPAAADPLRAEAPAVAAAAAGHSRRALRLIASTAYDYGYNPLVEVRFEDGTRKSLRLNGGASVALGAAFWPLLDGRLETRALVGVKYDSIRAANGSVYFLAIPLEITEAWNLRPFRLSGGASVLLAPRVRGSDFLEQVDLDLRNSLGLVAQAEWVLEFRQGGGSLSLGLRHTWQRFEATRGGRAHDGSALGAVLGVTL